MAWAFGRRRTLVEQLATDIDRTDDRGPDWQAAVEDAVLRQDMEWLQEAAADSAAAAAGEGLLV